MTRCDAGPETAVRDAARPRGATGHALDDGHLERLVVVEWRQQTRGSPAPAASCPRPAARPAAGCGRRPGRPRAPSGRVAGRGSRPGRPVRGRRPAARLHARSRRRLGPRQLDRWPPRGVRCCPAARTGDEPRRIVEPLDSDRLDTGDEPCLSLVGRRHDDTPITLPGERRDHRQHARHRPRPCRPATARRAAPTRRRRA